MKVNLSREQIEGGEGSERVTWRGFRPCTLVGFQPRNIQTRSRAHRVLRPIDSILEAERLIQDHATWLGSVGNPLAQILSSDGAKTGVKRSMEPAEYGNSYAPQGGAYSNDYSGNSYAAQSPREPEELSGGEVAQKWQAKRARVEQQTKMLVYWAKPGQAYGFSMISETSNFYLLES